MPFHSFKNVTIILAESDNLVSRNISSALVSRGARDIEICTDGDQLRQAINGKPADVMLCDVQLPNLNFFDAAQRIRRHEMGRNPFMHIVGTIGPTAHDQVQRAIGVGVDTLLVKPMSANVVLGRLDTLIRSRKPFIVADSYVGPNRRKGLRPGDEQLQVEVPNSLRSKVVDEANPVQIQQLIDKARLQVQATLAKAQPRAINSLASKILAYYEGKGTEEELKQSLDHLIEKSEDLATRYRDTDASHISEIADTMANLTKRIAEAPFAPKKADIEILSGLSDAIRMSLAAVDAGSSAQIVREIAETVRNFVRSPAHDSQGALRSL